MKIFQQAQNALAIYGIALHQHPFNWRNLMALFILFSAIISNVLYILCEAKSFHEYAESISMATAFNTVCFSYVYIIWMMERIFDCLLVETEKLVNSSECFY